MNFEKAKINSLSTNFEVEEESTCDYNDIDSCYKDIEYGDKKLNEKVYYADKAGRKAAWRALENSLALLSDGKHMSFLFLPEGADPDSYVNQYGKESFEQKLKQAMPLSEF